MGLRHLGDGQDVLLRQHRAGGIAGGVQQDRPGPGCDGLFDIRRLDPVVIFLIRGDGHRSGADAAGLPVVVGEAGIRHQDFIARVQQRHHGQEQSLHGPHGDDDVVFGIALPVLLPVLGGHRLPQLCGAGVGRVMGLPLVQGSLRRVLDVLGRVEVGFAHRQLDRLRVLGRQIKHLSDAGRWILLRPLGNAQFLFHW